MSDYFCPLDVACPLCRAPKNRRCFDLINGGRRSAQRGSHYERVNAAEKADRATRAVVETPEKGRGR